MSELPIRDGGMNSCCIDSIRAFEGRDDDGVSIGCAGCGKKLVVKGQVWMWRPVDTGPKYVFWGERPGERSRWTRLPGYQDGRR